MSWESSLSVSQCLRYPLKEARLTPKSLSSVSIMTSEPLVSKGAASTMPTLSTAQELLGQLLQQALEVLMSDWTCGDFQTMASGGMLLNGTLETTEILDARLEQQEKR